MIRNLKALGLVLVAAFAMSAFAASGAQAVENAEFESAGEDIDLVTDGAQTLVSPSFTLTCEGVEGTGLLPKQSPQLTTSVIKYEKCHTIKFGITFDITVDMNTCDYLFTAGEMVEEDTKSKGSVHIKCTTPGDSITITVYKAGTATTVEAHANAANLQCVIHVPEQTPKGVVTFHNKLTENVWAVTVTADELKVKEQVTDLNLLGCNEEFNDEATYTGSFWAKGTDVNKKFVDTTVTTKP